MAKRKRWQEIPTELSFERFLKFVLPHLSVGSRGPALGNFVQEADGFVLLADAESWVTGSLTSARQSPHVANDSIKFAWVIGGASTGIIMRKLAKARHSTDQIQVNPHMIKLGAE